jgi:hypothetical protein
MDGPALVIFLAPVCKFWQFSNDPNNARLGAGNLVLTSELIDIRAQWCLMPFTHPSGRKPDKPNNREVNDTPKNRERATRRKRMSIAADSRRPILGHSFLALRAGQLGMILLGKSYGPSSPSISSPRSIVDISNLQAGLSAPSYGRCVLYMR